MTYELFRDDATLLACEATVTGQGEGGVWQQKKSFPRFVLCLVRVSLKSWFLSSLLKT